ncbi:MAG: methyltransferase [Planctomycetota bacterium]
MSTSDQHATTESALAGEAWSLDVDFPCVREIFQRAGYKDAEVVRLLGGVFPTNPTPEEVAAFLPRTNGDSPLETLVRLFVLGTEVAVEAAREALRPMELWRWVRGGLIRVRNGSATATAKILPFQDLWLLCDLLGAGKPDHVMGIGGSTLRVLNMAIRRPVRCTLDLGTGSGIQALQAARHSEQVYATDCSPRALQFARFNAALNGVTNITFVDGDLFEPVAGMDFDLIVSNPPFVISPDSRFLYRDGHLRDDGAARALAGGAPKHLREGGFCHFICDVAHRHGETWQERSAEWFGDSGCDVWVIGCGTKDQVDYTRAWNSDDGPEENLSETFSRWLAYFEREKIAAITTVLITMRRRSGVANWFRADDGWEDISQPCGEAIAQGFGSQDFLETARDDELLLAARLRPAADVELGQKCVLSESGWRMQEARLKRVRGLRYADSVDPEVTTLIGHCDGKRTVRDVLQGQGLGTALGPYLEVMRRLIARQILLPV